MNQSYDDQCIQTSYVNLLDTWDPYRAPGQLEGKSPSGNRSMIPLLRWKFPKSRPNPTIPTLENLAKVQSNRRWSRLGIKKQRPKSTQIYSLTSTHNSKVTKNKMMPGFV